MTDKVQPGQSGSGVKKDEKPIDEKRQPAEQSKAGKPEETGSSSNSLPGSGPG